MFNHNYMFFRDGFGLIAFASTCLLLGKSLFRGPAPTDGPHDRDEAYTSAGIPSRRASSHVNIFSNPVTDALSGPIYALDRQGRLVGWNKALEELLGLPAERLQLISVIDLVHEDDRQLAASSISDAFDNGKAETEVRVLAQKGVTRFIFTGNRVEFNGECLLVGSGTSLDRHEQTEDKLRESERRYRSLFSSMSEGFTLCEMILDENGRPCDFRYLEANSAFERHTGWPLDSVIGKTVKELAPTIEQYWIEQYGRVAATGESTRLENRVEEIDRDFEAIAFSPGKGLFAAVFSDITERKRVEREREMTIQFQSIVNQSVGTGELIRRVTTFFQQQSRCEAIGIRLLSGDDYPYYEARGFPREFLLVENSLCVRDETGRVMKDDDGYPLCDCMCGNVIHGRFDPSKPFFSERGSFWTNCTTDLLSSTTDADRQARTRNRCNGEGYQSVALIPLALGSKRLGLLQLNDRRKGMFSPETIAFWERLAHYLSTALAKLEAEKVLREREALQSALMDTTDTGYVTVDMAGRVLDANAYYVHLVGESNLAEILGRSVVEWTAGHHQDKNARAVRECAENGLIRNLEIDYVDGSGNVVPVEINATVVFTERGPVMLGLCRDITERRKAEADLRKSEERMHSLYDAITDAMLVNGMDSTGRMLRFREVNDVTCKLLGYTRDELLSMKPADILAPRTSDDHERVRVGLQAQREMAYERVLVAKDGRQIPVEVHSRPFVLDGHAAVISLVHDITERKKAESQIRLQAAAIDAAADLIVILDRSQQIIFANSAFERQTGYTPKEFVDHSLFEFWPETADGCSREELAASVGLGHAWSGEMLCKSKEGTCCTVDVTITPLNSNGRVERLIAIARNITEKKAYEGLLEYRAHHDVLTDLPNRLLFAEELGRALTERRRYGQSCAVLFIDLDRFKLVNDTMGHPAGDAFLVEVAARLRSCLRDGDVLARMGGDEFTVLLRGLNSPADAVAAVNRMMDHVSKPFSIEGTKLVISASVGVSLYPENGSEVDELLRNADAAMYKAKELAGNCCQFYSEELNQANRARVETENDLRLAVKRNELKAYYQPIVDASSMRVVGAEALLRWNHPVKGMISPGMFVPIAEETGMISEIGRTMLEAACAQCKQWQEQGFAELGISVNVSPVQLRNEQFVHEVREVLSNTGLSPEHLNLEITETVLARNDHGELDRLGKLRDFGVKTCLDDFGIGYSSLSRLSSFPIVHIKVDGSFIRDIVSNSKDRAMTESIIALAHNLGIQVTAEWIENEEQLAIIRTMGCDYAQGYLVSPPLSAEDFEKFARDWSGRLNDKAA
jgi:diguanylate cyclase (GGDEF)-like protein/PAS domain S-box-containing protein